jgi:hypothetical protein
MPLGYLSIGVMFLLALNNSVSKRSIILLTIAIFVAMFFKLLSGSLAQAVLLLVFLGILYWAKMRSLPWSLIFICCVITILLNPMKQEYRNYTEVTDSSTKNSYYNKATMFYKATYNHYANYDFSTSDVIGEGVINRVGHSISSFADVINTTPDLVPYWMGGSYQTLWTSFIPRFLWPGKPQATVGNEFGHRYNLLGLKDNQTSHNLPWLTEFYANFGILGVVAGMFAVGVGFRFLVQKLSVPISYSIEYVLSTTVTFSLFYAESNFALMVGGILTPYLALLILIRLLTLW